MGATVTRVGNMGSQSSMQAALARGLKFEMGTFAFTGTDYPTGGEDVSGKFGFTPDVVILESDDGYILKYDATNQKVLAYYADYDAAADGALIQVAADVDLSGVSAKYIAFGF